MIDLSILICSTHTRANTFGRKIQDQVWPQYEALPQQYKDRIEIIMLVDNKQMMLGHKRNVMVDMAQGRYVQFIDDDDRIEPDMFATILDAITEHPAADVITFLVAVTMNGGESKLCKYSMKYTVDQNTPDLYERLPNHICVINREVAMLASFPNQLYGEDSTYSKLLHPHLENEYHIPRVLYHYDYDDQTTETQYHRNAAPRRRPQPPIVDVVMMSNADTKALQQMTQRAITSCIAGANSLPVNIIVLEQQPDITYINAATIYAPGEFNYNAFANRGAKYGNADWIMIANNDLLFQDGWLHQLLIANYPIVSPKSPPDIRQAHITENTTGYNNAEHLSGWCFMIKRALWERIGGFDTDFAFWCADDSLIEQLRAIDIPPMMVPGSHVHHLGSLTLNSRPKAQRDELMWPYIELFNRKYNQDKFANDSRFMKWKKSHELVK